MRVWPVQPLASSPLLAPRWSSLCRNVQDFALSLLTEPVVNLVISAALRWSWTLGTLTSFGWTRALGFFGSSREFLCLSWSGLSDMRNLKVSSRAIRVRSLLWSLELSYLFLRGLQHHLKITSFATHLLHLFVLELNLALEGFNLLFLIINHLFLLMSYLLGSLECLQQLFVVSFEFFVFHGSLLAWFDFFLLKFEFNFKVPISLLKVRKLFPGDRRGQMLILLVVSNRSRFFLWKIWGADHHA